MIIYQIIYLLHVQFFFYLYVGTDNVVLNSSLHYRDRWDKADLILYYHFTGSYLQQIPLPKDILFMNKAAMSHRHLGARWVVRLAVCKLKYYPICAVIITIPFMLHVIVLN